MKEINHISDLKPDEKNARRHNPRNIAMISKSLGEVGVGRSIVIDEDGNILAGNGTVEALAECGITDVRVIKANGNELIAVQRTGLSEEQKKKLALFDNRTAELADWDPEILKEINIDMPDLLENMFMPIELDDILSISRDIEPVEGEDDVPERLGDTITKTGDLYILGEHRLMCGDSTDKTTVEQLMDGQKADMVFTDPPYGIDVVGNSPRLREEKKLGTIGRAKLAKAGNYKPVIGDETTEAAKKCHQIINEFAKDFIYWGGNYFTDFLPPSRGWIIWDKRNGATSFADAEVAWTSFDKSIRLYSWLWSGMRREGNHLEEGKLRWHPTQKPVGLIAEIIGEWCEGKSILDPFGGSGSTLIACEKMERKCYMMEIDPGYCDVIIRRWEEFSGKKAELVNQEVVTIG